MKKKLDLDQFFVKSSEVALGLVAPVGTDFDAFMANLRDALGPFDYEVNEIRMSTLADALKADDPLTGAPPPPAPEQETYCDRTTRLMTAGDNVRALHPEVLALAAVEKIRQTRPPTAPDERSKKFVHVVRSLKHPSEVHLLRRVYGPGFFLVGVVTNRDDRIAFLRRPPHRCDDADILKLFERDEHGSGKGGEGGQRTRDTYQLADAFVRLGDTASLQRLLALIFGAPHETPTPDEHAMFLAFSAALRSGDLSRQVGAVIASSAGDIVAVGTNDVPIAGGGLCWPGEFDHRDHSPGYRYDSNETRRSEIVDDVLDLLRETVDNALQERRPADDKDPTKWKVDQAKWRADGRARLAAARLKHITEYGRAVHAEMEALLSCARSGISTKGATLYSTTFPCHNCAKHIIAAGIDRVLYIEPYPKSQAMPFYSESIADGRTASDLFVPTSTGGPRSREIRKVMFEPFVGVGPRRFFDLFSMELSSGRAIDRKTNGIATTWTPKGATPRVPLHEISFLQREDVACDLLLDLTKREESHEDPDPKHGDG
jgi:deoxycytidylate deaminase